MQTNPFIVYIPLALYPLANQSAIPVTQLANRILGDAVASSDYQHISAQRLLQYGGTDVQTKRTSMRLKPAVHARLNQLAKANNISQASLLRLIWAEAITRLLQ